MEGYYYCVKEIQGNPSEPLRLEMLSRRMLRKEDAEDHLNYCRHLKPSVPPDKFFIYFREEPMDDIHKQILKEYHD